MLFDLIKKILPIIVPVPPTFAAQATLKSIIVLNKDDIKGRRTMDEGHGGPTNV